METNSIHPATAPSDILMSLGQSMRRARLLKGLSQAELAHRADLSEGVIKKIETGANITLESWVSVMQVLGYSQDLLFVCKQNKPASITQHQKLSSGNFKERKRSTKTIKVATCP